MAEETVKYKWGKKDSSEVASGESSNFSYHGKTSYINAKIILK